MSKDQATITFADGVSWTIKGEMVSKLRALRDKRARKSERSDRYKEQLRQSGGGRDEMFEALDGIRDIITAQAQKSKRRG